jgi:hypothetical protein
MQKRQQQRFSMLHTLMQLWNEQVSLSIRYSYVPVGNGFTAPDSYRDGKNNSDKIRPWFER